MYIHAKINKSVVDKYDVAYMGGYYRDRSFEFLEGAIEHVQKQEFRLVSVTHNDLGHSKEFWFVKNN